MPVTVNQVSSQYREAIEQLRSILEDPEAGDKQRAIAQEAIDDLYLLLGTNPIQRVDGRSALLTALIAELTAVSDSIRLHPVGDVLDELTELIDTGRALYTESKQDLAHGDGDGSSIIALG